MDINVYNRIANIGLKEGDSEMARFRVSMINKSASIIALAMLLLLIHTLFTDRKAIEWNIITTVSPVIPIFFNYNRKFHISFFFVRYIFPILVFTLYILFGDGLGVDYVFFISLVGNFVLNDSKKSMTLNLLFLLILFFVAKIYTFYVAPPFAHAVLQIDALASLSISIIIIGICIYDSFTILLKQNVNIIVNNEKLKVQNDSLNTLIEKNNFNNELLAILAHDLHSPANAFNQISNKVSYLIRKKDDT